MIRSFAVSILTIQLLWLAGCASTGEIVELKKYDGLVDSHKVVMIDTVANPSIKGDETNRQRFAKILARQLGKTEIFDEIVIGGSKPATLKVVSQFTYWDEPSDAATVFAGGLANAEVKVRVQLLETAKKRELASLDVTGNSKMRGRTTVAGVGVTEADDFTETAMTEAAIRVANYIRSHSSKKQPE